VLSILTAAVKDSTKLFFMHKYNFHTQPCMCACMFIVPCSHSHTHTHTHFTVVPIHTVRHTQCEFVYIYMSVCSMRTQHIRQTTGANISNFFPSHKPNICFDMGMNGETAFQQIIFPLSLSFSNTPILACGKLLQL